MMTSPGGAAQVSRLGQHRQDVILADYRNSFFAKIGELAEQHHIAGFHAQMPNPPPV